MGALYLMCAALLLSRAVVTARLSYSEIPQTEDVRAPLLLRKDGSEANHPLVLFMNKYGMTGSKKVKHAHKKDSKRQKKQKKGGKDASDDSGWMYGDIYSGTTCSGTKYMQGGIKLGQCIPVYSSESFYMTCDDDGYVTMSKYSDETCTTLTESVYIAQSGCGTTSSWYTDDSVSEENSVQISCSSSSTPPYESDGIDYDLCEFFASSSSSTCASDDMILYEAFPLDTCIPMDQSTYGYSSLEFDQTSSGVGYLKYFTSSKMCSGTAKTAVLSTTCSAMYSKYDIYYKWAAFSA